VIIYIGIYQPFVHISRAVPRLMLDLGQISLF